MEENYLVYALERGNVLPIGIVHDLTENTLKRVKVAIEKDSVWAAMKLKVNLKAPHRVTFGVRIPTNHKDIDIIFHKLNEI